MSFSKLLGICTLPVSTSTNSLRGAALQFLRRHCLSDFRAHSHRSYSIAAPSSQSSYGHRSLLPLIRSSSNLLLSTGPWNDENTRHWIANRGDSKDAAEETVLPFFLDDPKQTFPIGFLRMEVFRAMEADHQKFRQLGAVSPWTIYYRRQSEPWSLSFAPSVNGIGRVARTEQIGRLTTFWKQNNMFSDILRGWSNEAYPVYQHVQGSKNAKLEPIAFTVERASLPLFGFANFGCLLIAHFQCPDTGQVMLWIPRRSMNKRTWPGRMDVTVGGGISAGDSAFSTIVRECAEEASLDVDYVSKNVRAVGVLPFPNRSPSGWILPGLYYLFELPMPNDRSIYPRTNVADGEVESFEPMDIHGVLENLLAGVFKPSSALAIVDFLIRHGYITDETDPEYVELCLSLKRGIQPWPLPHGPISL